MSYYPTIEEDLQRAREILAKGLVRFDVGVEDVITGGHISGGDTFAAYKLLESFVAEIERLRGWQCERCGGTGRQRAGLHRIESGAYDSVAGPCEDCGGTGRLRAEVSSPARQSLIDRVKAMERIIPANLEGDDLWNRNGEYVSLDDVLDLLAEVSSPARPEPRDFVAAQAEIVRLRHALNTCEIHQDVPGIAERTACALCLTDALADNQRLRSTVRRMRR